jgi:translation initiation factor IF-1
MKKSKKSVREEKEPRDRMIMEGIVEEALPGTLFKVRIVDSGLDVLAVLSGKMRQRRIHVLLGDVVSVEVSAYDVQKGRIVWRR